MTEHELEVRKSDKAWKRHRRWLREYEAQRKADDERWTAYARDSRNTQTGSQSEASTESPAD